MYTSTRRLAYRQELDILENLEDALNDCANVEETVYSVADQWPHHAHNLRVIQWLHAGSPDLDEISLGDAYDSTTDIISGNDRNSVTASLHAMLGVVLYGMAHDYMFDIVSGDDLPWEALAKVKLEIMEHRADLMQHDGYAMKPPYQFNIYSGHQATYTIHVTD
jgi:hypothetical protein